MWCCRSYSNGSTIYGEFFMYDREIREDGFRALKNTVCLLRAIIHRFSLSVNCKKLGHRDSKHLANLFNGIYRKLAASAARDAKRRVGDVSALT